MKTKTLALPVIVISLLAFTFANTWTADTGKAKIEFETASPMGKVNGSFKGFKSTIKFDPNDLAGSSITASVDVSTIETGIALRNKDLRDKEEWFNAVKYPQITIKSKSIEKIGNGYKMSADLTIKGITKSVSIPFSFAPAGGGGLFTSQFTLNRQDYGLGKSGSSGDQSVTIKLEVPVTK